MTGQTLRRLGLASVFGAVHRPADSRHRPGEGAARPGQAGQERTADRPDAKPEKAKWTVKVFELKHRNPEEMNQILTKQWHEPQPAVMASTVMIGPGGYPVRVGIPQPPSSRSR